MSNVTLASGQITPTDQLSIELVQAIETPEAAVSGERHHPHPVRGQGHPGQDQGGRVVTA